MTDDSLECLRRILCHMDGDAEIHVGIADFTASELFEVVEDALQARALVKAADEERQRAGEMLRALGVPTI